MLSAMAVSTTGMGSDTRSRVDSARVSEWATVKPVTMIRVPAGGAGQQDHQRHEQQVIPADGDVFDAQFGVIRSDLPALGCFGNRPGDFVGGQQSREQQAIEGQYPDDGSQRWVG